VESTMGQAHCPIFKVTLEINAELSSTKEAPSKREAEQACAMDILDKMNVGLTSIKSLVVLWIFFQHFLAHFDYFAFPLVVRTRYVSFQKVPFRVR